MATGVLLVCLGQATRLIEYLMTGRKAYRATVRFGQTTDTLDAEGTVTAERDPSHVTETRLREILPAFVGQIEQRPPIFSALKKGGQPLYKLARTGQTVNVESRPVTIFALNWVTWQPPDLTLDVVCSPGTYIRSLARDLGEVAGPGAHLSALTRTANGEWSLTDAVSLARLEESSAVWQRYLHAPDRAVSHLAAVTLDEETAWQVSHGQQIELSQLSEQTEKEDLVRAYAPTGQFLAILTRIEPDDKLWQPKKVFHPGRSS
jgi:tRNA pseudouridine55 synthase